MGGGRSGTSESHPPAESWNLPTPFMIPLRLPARRAPPRSANGELGSPCYKASETGKAS